MDKVSENNGRSARPTGMTLAEMLVSMVIMAFVLAAVVPLFRHIRIGWESKKAGGVDAVQSGGILMDHISRNLCEAVRITSVSSSADQSGYIEFEDNDGNTLRYDLFNSYVRFGPDGSLSQLAGPVESLVFTCYDACDLDTAVTDCNVVRVVEFAASMTDFGDLGSDRDFLDRVYLRTGVGTGASPAVAYWKLDETFGTTANDSAGGHDGTYHNSVSLNGQAAYFDGSNDYVDVPHSGQFLLDEGSVAMWFNAADISERCALFSKDSTNYDTGGHLTIYHESYRFKVRLQSTGSSYYVESDNDLAGGTWYHTAFTWGPEGMKLYLNGQLVDTDSYTGGLGTSSGGAGNYEPIAIGANTWQSYNLVVTPLQDYYQGYIDEVTLCNRALTPAEILTLYQNGLGTMQPVAHWKFDESSGTSASDDTGNGHTGTIHGAGFTGGLVNNAVGFDGWNDYVEVPHSDDFLLDNGTICLWFKSDDVYYSGTMLSKDSENYDTGGHLTIYNSQWRTYVRLQGVYSSDYVYSSDLLEEDNWYHVAFTFGGGGMKLYVNGELEDTDLYTGGLGTSSGGAGNYEPMAIGASTVYSGNRTITPLDDYFDGIIDDVRIYGQVLSGGQIEQLAMMGTDTGLVAHWRFDESSGTSAADSSGNGNNATLANGASFTGGLIGNAVWLDGSNDAVYCGNFSVSPTITMAAWIRADDFDIGDARIVSKAYGTSEYEHYWMLSTYQYYSSIRPSMRIKAGWSTKTFTPSSGNISSGTWTHLAATWDGYFMRLYKDGESLGYDTLSGTLSTSSSVGVAVGNQPNGKGSRPFDGLIDDVRIYNCALGASQLKALAEMTVPDCNFVAYDPNSDADAGFFETQIYP